MMFFLVDNAAHDELLYTFGTKLYVTRFAAMRFEFLVVW